MAALLLKLRGHLYELILRTFRETNAGREFVKRKNAEDMFRKLRQ